MMMQMNVKSVLLGLAIGVCCMLAMAQTTNPTGWEYHILRGGQDLSALASVLDSSGRQGWEAVAAGEDGGRSWVLLKRAR